MTNAEGPSAASVPHPPPREGLELRRRILDFGAGRGGHAEREGGFVRRLTRLKGKVVKVIGVDVDPAVRDNPDLDVAVRIDPNARLPLEDGSVDLIVPWA